MKKTENIVPVAWTTCGTPASVSALAAAVCRVSATREIRSYTSSVASRSVVRPAVVATGFPDRVPAW